MNVLYFAGVFPGDDRPNRGIFNLRAAVELAQLVDLTVVAPRAWRPGRRGWSEETYAGLRVVRPAAPLVPGAPRLTLRLFRARLQRPMQALLARADVVHSVGAEFAGLLVGALARQRRFRHVTQIINELDRQRIGFESYPYLDALRRNLDGVVCNSRALESSARRWFPLAPVVRTAYRGADLARFSPAGARAPVFPESAGVRLAYLGGLPTYADRAFGADTKGGRTLMAAWRGAEDELARAGAALFFGGPDSESPAVQAWRNSLTHPDLVRLGGMVPPADVPAILRAADAVLLPSREEGCPNVAFEAFASGRALIGSDIASIAELVGAGEGGFTVAAGDVAAWRDALVRVAAPAARADLLARGVVARKTAERLFDQRNYARKLVEMYREIANLPR